MGCVLELFPECALVVLLPCGFHVELEVFQVLELRLGLDELLVAVAQVAELPYYLCDLVVRAVALLVVGSLSVVDLDARRDWIARVALEYETVVVVVLGLDMSLHPGVSWSQSEQLAEDAAHAPTVNLLVVVAAGQDDFWRPVHSCLHLAGEVPLGLSALLGGCAFHVFIHF